MKMGSICRAAGSFLVLALGAWTAAQAAQAGESPARAGLRERISDLYLLRLTRALDLTEDQTAKVYPLLTRLEKEKAKLQRGLGLDLRDLREKLGGTVPPEAELQGLVDRIRQARRAIRLKDEEAEAGLDGVLTPVQRARYLLFNVDFLRNIGENLGRARGARGPLKRSP
jgi:Spy/CpxP family protein refolding chaperone